MKIQKQDFSRPPFKYLVGVIAIFSCFSAEHFSCFPVEPKYQIAIGNKPRAIRFGSIKPIMRASPKIKNVSTKKSLPSYQRNLLLHRDFFGFNL